MKKRILSMLATGLVALSAHAAEKPNVVLMLADNLGYGDLSCYNGGSRGGITTPNIDQLASEGMRFTQFLCEPGCTPSRAGLLTGQYSIRSGMSLIIVPGASGGLQPDDVTLGTTMKSAGYNTTYVGKWHLGPEAQSQPQNQGFDQWLVGFKGTTDSVLYSESLKTAGAPDGLQKAAATYITEAKKPGEAAKVVQIYDREYRRQIESDIADAAVGYIKEQADKEDPFFLMVGWTRPHFPNDAHPDFVGKSNAGPYGDSIVELDARTGQVLDAIDEAGIKNNTIVIWLSDNGATVTGTVPAEVGGGSNGPFRGELGDGYEGSIRTAGMIRWPGKIAPSVNNEMVSVHDFLPTLANIVGEELPDDRPYDGFDQTDWLLGKQVKSNRQHLLTFVGDRLIAVRWNQFRIYPIEYHSSSTNPVLGGYLGTIRETAGMPRIYDINADPGELMDIAVSGNGWVLGIYSKLIKEYKATLKDHPNPPAPNMTKF
ncbi:sulfatase-like hydrolase/transferase [Pelagicoccus mobilis]|uniref:Sulfatase-like hydrolase/transferase n=1 Tax=Pelagicoccus mobilis TaxID=415221 RepID=A0A934S5G6_9BACT|nr:sulfatase-like hydrolase/transferase [Pelagicoccus mobilis]MBK1879303.1 sulfatase-like hydrolase/transferase [Pelagicoccus mobilis]